MAKRSREDFEHSIPEPEYVGDPTNLEPSVESSEQTEHASESAKIVHMDSSGETPPPIAMKCSLPPHRQAISFTSHEEYEIHYNKNHVNRCLECRKNFPTEHFLSLHIEENHDALVSVRKERGEKTVCFPLW